MAAPADERLKAEFDVLMARAGLTIPPERGAELLVAFADLRAEIPRLYAAPLPANLEPAAVYRVTSPRGAGEEPSPPAPLPEGEGRRRGPPVPEGEGVGR